MRRLPLLLVSVRRARCSRLSCGSRGRERRRTTAASNWMSCVRTDASPTSLAAHRQAYGVPHQMIMHLCLADYLTLVLVALARRRQPTTSSAVLRSSAWRRRRSNSFDRSSSLPSSANMRAGLGSMPPRRVGLDRLGRRGCDPSPSRADAAAPMEGPATAAATSSANSGSDDARARPPEPQAASLQRLN